MKNRIKLLASLIILNLLILSQSSFAWADDFTAKAVDNSTTVITAITYDKNIVAQIDAQLRVSEATQKQQERSIPVDYSRYEDVYNNYIYPLSKIIYAEAGNMGDKHQQYVGYVVMNRVYSKYYPNSIHDVFFSSGYDETSKERYLKNLTTKQAIKNAKIVINTYFNEGLVELPVSKAMTFQAEFKQGVNIIQMGNTYFGCDPRILKDMKESK